MTNSTTELKTSYLTRATDWVLKSRPTLTEVKKAYAGLARKSESDTGDVDQDVQETLEYLEETYSTLGGDPTDLLEAIEQISATSPPPVASLSDATRGDPEPPSLDTSMLVDHWAEAPGQPLEGEAKAAAFMQLRKTLSCKPVPRPRPSA